MGGSPVAAARCWHLLGSPRACAASGFLKAVCWPESARSPEGCAFKPAGPEHHLPAAPKEAHDGRPPSLASRRSWGLLVFGAAWGAGRGQRSFEAFLDLSFVRFGFSSSPCEGEHSSKGLWPGQGHEGGHCEWALLQQKLSVTTFPGRRLQVPGGMRGAGREA